MENDGGLASPPPSPSREGESARQSHCSRCARLEAQLIRNRQGLRNILEVRKLDSRIWGERDGYGGRYGALTREEIETVIAEIDQALIVERTPSTEATTSGEAKTTRGTAGFGSTGR